MNVHYVAGGVESATATVDRHGEQQHGQPEAGTGARQDYSVVDANPVTIPFENGAATQTDVTFTYQRPEAVATVSAHYVAGKRGVRH